MPYNKSIIKAFDILNLFSSEVPELSLSEVAQKLQMNKSTTSRLISTLISVGVLNKSPSTKKYLLGKKISELAKVFFSTVDLNSIALPYMQKLLEETSENISIQVLDGDERLCNMVLESTHKVRQVCSEGDRFPLHAGSPGRLLLAYMPDRKIEEILERTGQPRITDITITNRKELKKNLEEIRRSGIAISYGECIEFCFSVSAPIRDYTGEVVAALNIAGIILRMTPEKEQEYVKMVSEVADSISRDIGWYHDKLNRDARIT